MRYYVTTLALFLLPMTAGAQVVITEIMYAPEAGVAHEWFEILNSSGSEIDLTDWRFDDEGSSKHGFEEPPKNGGQGALLISEGEYAIVAKEADTFLSAHSGFSGTVIDASFSLTDKGKKLTLFDEGDSAVNTASYGENAGAKKNGLSLQLISGSWVAASPTPGAANSAGSSSSGDDSNTDTDTGSDTDTSTNTGDSSGGSFAPPDPRRISVDGGPDITVIAGADVVLSAEGYGTGGEPLEGLPRYLWVFGDGSTTEGKTVVHSFTFPGEYSVVVHVSSGKYSASDYVNVTAEPSALAITEIRGGLDGYIEMHNGSRETISLSYWLLRTPDEQFSFPPNTRIRPGARVKFPNHITDLAPSLLVELLYPNGSVAFRYTPPKTSATAPTAKPISSTGRSSSETASESVISPRSFQVSDEVSVEKEVEEATTTLGVSAATTSDTERNSAMAVLSLPAAAGNQPTTPWLLVFGGLIGLAALAVVVIRGDLPVRDTQTGAGSESVVAQAGDIERVADRITIIEEEE